MVFDNVPVKRDTKNLLQNIMDELKKEGQPCTYDSLVRESVEAMMIMRKASEQLVNLQKKGRY